MKRMTWLIALAMVTAIPALGQDPGMPPPPQHGGPGMRPPRGPMGMMGGPRILFRQDVQKELKLTAAQLDTLRELLHPGGPGLPPPGGPEGGPDMAPPPLGGPGGPDGPGGMGPGGRGGFGGPPPMMDEKRRHADDAKIKGVLDAGQFARYKQLSLQIEGPRAFTRQDVATKLGLTEDQQEEIRSILDEMRPRPPQMGGDDQIPPQAPSFEQMETRRDAVIQKLLTTLTDSQRTKWNAMVGKLFQFERPPFRRGPGR